MESIDRKNDKHSKKGKKEDKKKKIKQPKNKIPRMHQINAFVTFCMAVRNQMSIAVSSLSPSKKTKQFDSDKEMVVAFKQLKDVNPSAYAMYSELLRTLSKNIFGVWQPRIVMKSADNSTGGQAVVTDGAASLLNQLSIQANVLAGISLLWGIFDEYKPTGPFRCFFTPSDTSTSRLYGIGVIDYSNNSALTNVDEAMSYDTKKIFDLQPYHTVFGGVAEWKGYVIGIPDKQWVSTGTNATWAYWKTYPFNVGDASWSISATYGYWTFEIEVEFRQLNEGG